MANFANLTAQLNLNINNFAKNMQKASAMTNQFAANMQGQINAGMVDPVKKSKFEFKDVARIVQGIVISKAFYSGLNAIRRATDAVWEFSKELEYAQMVYTNLFQSKDLAVEFINVLKDFAAVTPFSFQQSEQAAKRLLAYGIEAKNVMYVMQGVMAAATVQGNDSIIEPISRALGQIYTKGRLMNEEMRQLAEAGIPVYEILEEKLGLTTKQLRNLGKTAIPASTAINALVDGITERFGPVLNYASMTTKGVISNIKDNMTMLVSGVFEPLAAKIRVTVAAVGEFINELRMIYDLKGLGGVFEKLVPVELQGALKQTIAILKLLVDVIKTELATGATIAKAIFTELLHVFNALAPAIVGVIGMFAALRSAIASNEKLVKFLSVAILTAAAAWAIYRLQAMASAATIAVINGIRKAVVGVIAAFNFLVAHPAWALLAFGVGVFVALTGSSEKFRNSINNLYKSLFNMGGMDPSKMLMPEFKDRESDIDKFNNKLTDTGKGLDDVADKTKKAGDAAKKAAKGLLSFDEVFSLKEPADDKDKGGDTLPDIGDMGGLGDLGDFSGMDFELPDFGALTSNFVDGIIDAFGGAEQLLSTGLGALLGGILGGLLGGPWGAALGAFLGGLAGWFWPKIAEALNLTDIGTVALPLATMLGAIIGGLIGGPMGALIGAGIGALVGWIIDAFARGFVEGDWSQVGKPIGLGIGAAIGYLMGGPLGALIGGAIGLLVGWVVDQITKGFQSGEWNIVGISTGLGTLIGMAIGAIVGGPAGAVIGAAIGTLVGWVAGMLGQKFKDGTLTPTDIGMTIGGLLGAAIGGVLGGPTGALIGASIGIMVGQIIGWIAEKFNEGKISTTDISMGIGTLIGGAIGLIVGGPAGAVIGAALGAVTGWVFDNLVTKFKEGTLPTDEITTRIGAGIGGAIGFVMGGPMGASIGATIGAVIGWVAALLIDNWSKITDWFDSIGPWFATLGEKIGTMFSNLVTGVETFFTDIYTALSTAFNDVINGVVTWFTELTTSVSTWFTDTKTYIKTSASGMLDPVMDSWKDVFNAVDTVLKDLWKAITTVFNDIVSALTRVGTDILNAVKTVWNDVYTAISTVLGRVWDVVREIFLLVFDLIVKVVKDIWQAVSDWFNKVYDVISEKVQAVWKTVSEWFGKIFDIISEKVTAMWTTVSEWFTKIWNIINEKLQAVWTNVTEWFTKIWTIINEKLQTVWNNVSEWFQKIWTIINEKLQNVWKMTGEWFQKMWAVVNEKLDNIRKIAGEIYQKIWDVIKEKVEGAYKSVKTFFGDMYTAATGKINEMYTSVSSGIGNIYKAFTGWIGDLWSNVFSKFFDWIDKGIDKLRDFFGLESKASSVDTSRYDTKYSPGPAPRPQYARALGGIFNKEHIASFAEGGKAEAIIPLEHDTAMRPFVDAVSDGLLATLAPLVANFNGGTSQNDLRPLYVGTLIADERGLKELNRKMNVIQLEEDARRGY